MINLQSRDRWRSRWRINNPGVTLGLTFESCSCDSSFVISWFLFLGKTIPCGRYFVIFTQGVFLQSFLEVELSENLRMNAQKRCFSFLIIQMYSTQIRLNGYTVANETVAVCYKNVYILILQFRGYLFLIPRA